MKNLTKMLPVALLLACAAPNPDAAADAEPAEPQPLEFGDAKYTDMAKSGMTAFMNEDLAAFTANMADDAIYIFNAGDTLAGKAAITEFWQGRMDAIESSVIDNDVWLAMKVNESESVMTGNWVMGWFDVEATYTTGKSMKQSVHTLYHFNDSDMIDVTVQYLDRAPIMAAQSED